MYTNLCQYWLSYICVNRGWTVVLYTPPGATLERRRKPRSVNSFEAAAVDPTPILSLPNHQAEPSLAALDWTEEEHERFDSMQTDFRSLQMTHWLRSSNAGASHHLLGGYALFQQEFPDEVLEKGLTMFLQIGTDDNTGMCWGDGGELTFYADAKALRKGRFERLWGTCQCGVAVHFLTDLLGNSAQLRERRFDRLLAWMPLSNSSKTFARGGSALSV
ncbi:MAG TPA: DUF1963 domain-containing protein [Gemmataceae bacterium]|nr:DUF1963 domain-containing protein [Gemmataceae bacterium]